MNTDFLKTFMALAENGNFSKTAKELYVAQSTISNRIRELEKEVGQILFIRNKNYAELTLAGKALLEYAGQIISLEDKAIEQINSASMFTDRLVLGTVYAFFDCHLCANVENFMALHPSIALRLIFGHSSAIITAVRQSKVDIGYSHHPLNHPGFNCDVVCEDEIVFVTGGHNNKHQKGVIVDMVKDMCVYYSNFLYMPTHNMLFPKHQQFSLDIDVGGKMIPFLMRGERYAFLPKRLIESELSCGKLLEIPILDDTLPALQNYIIYRHEHPKTNAIKKWIDAFNPMELPPAF